VGNTLAVIMLLTVVQLRWVFFRNFNLFQMSSFKNVKLRLIFTIILVYQY
jgi:hypothetical protein